MGDNTATNDRITTPNTQAYGSWQFDFDFQTNTGGAAQVIRYFTSASSTILNNGYYVYLDGSGVISFRRIDNGNAAPLINNTFSNILSSNCNKFSGNP